jgi:hypothetical protein
VIFDGVVADALLSDRMGKAPASFSNLLMSLYYYFKRSIIISNALVIKLGFGRQAVDT